MSYTVDPVFGDERLPARFWDKVNPCADTGCWNWTAACDTTGYGRFHTGGSRENQKLVPAHRHAYGALVAPIAAELQADHLCRNRTCVNPGHIEPVTHRVNSLRGTGLPAVNAAKTHCKRGHEFSTWNTYLSWHGSVQEPRRTCRVCRLEWGRIADAKRRGTRRRSP